MIKFTSGAQKQAVNGLIDLNIEDGKHRCGCCGKAYKRKGACMTHVFVNHRHQVNEDTAIIQKNWDKKIDEMTKESAVKYGERYFEYLEGSIKDLLQTVERHRRHFDEALKEKPYMRGGKKREQRQMVNEIEYCMHHVVSNFQNHTSEGLTAVKTLTSAFKFDF